MSNQTAKLIKEVKFTMAGANSGEYIATGIYSVHKNALPSSIIVTKKVFKRGRPVQQECFDPAVLEEAALKIERKATIARGAA